MKKTLKLLIFCFATMLMLLSTSSVNVSAKVKNPFTGIKKTYHFIAGSPSEYGMDFITPSYSSKIKMTATSSKKSVATVKAYTAKEGKKYYGYIGINPKSKGTTTLTLKVTIKGKTYKKTCKVSVEKYVNPFDSLVIDGVDYTSKMDKKLDVVLSPDYFNGTISYKIKPDYKISYFYADDANFNSYDLSNGMKLKKKTVCLALVYKNTKTKAKGIMYIYSKKGY